MTEYEKLVEEKVMPPMNSMDALIISSSVDDAVKDNFINEEEKELLSELWLEIEFLYKDNKEVLSKISNLLGKNVT